MQRFYVENIKCGGCANAIQSELLKLPAVEQVEVDPVAGTVVITGRVKPIVVFDKLSEMGYPEIGKNNILKKAKSYVSCAIGKITQE